MKREKCSVARPVLLAILSIAFLVALCSCSLEGGEESLVEESSGNCLVGSISESNGAKSLKCDEPTEILVKDETYKLDEVFFEGVNEDALSCVAGEQAMVRIRDIQEKDGKYFADAQFFASNDIFVPMGCLVAKYPVQWGDSLAVDLTKSNNGNEKYTFVCEYKNNRYPLFEIELGSGLDRIYGFILLSNREVEISIDSFENKLPEDADDELRQMYASMQEDINYLVDGLADNENFVLNIQAK